MSRDRIEKPDSPLQTFQHVRTTNVAELEEAVCRHYTGVTFDVSSKTEKLEALACRCELSDITLTYGRHGAQVNIGVPELDVHSLLFAYRGSAVANRQRRDVEIGRESALIATAGEGVNLSYGADFEQLILSVNPIAMIRKLEALLGENLGHRLAFAPATTFRRPMVENLRRQFMFMVGQFDSSGSDIHPTALAEFEQTMIVSFLLANDNNYSVRLRRQSPAAAPWQVRKIESYIEANWDQPMTIEALALVAGGSARALFHAFRTSRGYSPMDFAKRIRLQKAKEMLSCPDPSTSVTSVAFTCGFSNLGHFSVYYHKAFSEPPSATLRRARQRD